MAQKGPPDTQTGRETPRKAKRSPALISKPHLTKSVALSKKAFFSNLLEEWTAALRVEERVHQ
jgi:hypothetical protein